MVMHVRVHEFNTHLVMSLDLPKHHEEGLVAQRDILDELLEQPEPLPLVVATPYPSPTTDGRFLCTPSPSTVSIASSCASLDAATLCAETEPSPVSGDFCDMSMPRTQTTSTESPEVITQMQRMRHTFLTDALIYKYVDVHGPRWRQLSRSLGGRALGYSDDVVRNRYIRICNTLGQPYQSTTARTKTPKKPEHEVERWTIEEDKMLVIALNMHGTRWGDIVPIFKGRRTHQAVRNRASRIGLLAHDKQCKEC